MTFSIVLLIIASLLIVAAFVLTVKPRWVAAVPAWGAMLLLYWGGYIQPTTLPMWKLAMWTLATAIVVALRRYQPTGEPDGRNTGNLYIGLAAVVGALLGIVMGPNYVLLGTIVGAVVGLMAYSRTPHGKWIKFASSTFIQYFCARCLPAIVAVAIMGIGVESILFYIRTCFFYSGV
ncbi:MAG: hypothetical protein Q4B68_03225 [Bacteroidales bacterium]|nr:hypothetical protein [Bacteroidales bacterium]